MPKQNPASAEQAGSAFAGLLPDPENTDPVKNGAVMSLLEHFGRLDIKPVLIPFHTLRHSTLARRELRAKREQPERMIFGKIRDRLRM